MGVYIKGMEMPRDCIDCNFAIDGCCVACSPIRVRNWEDEEITNHCPLVEADDPYNNSFNELVEAQCNLIDAAIDYIKAYEDAKDYLESCGDEMLVELMTDWYNKLTK